MVDDGLKLEFGREARATVYRDGTVFLYWHGAHHVGMPVLDGMLQDVATAQRRMPHPVRESHLFLGFGSSEVQVTEGLTPGLGRRADAPYTWDWDTVTVTDGVGLQQTQAEFRRRFWRAAGKLEFDPPGR